MYGTFLRMSLDGQAEDPGRAPSVCISAAKVRIQRQKIVKVMSAKTIKITLPGP